MHVRRGQEAHYGSPRAAFGDDAAPYPSKEIASGTLNAILKQLGLKGM
jgi:hypothetical protein